MSLPQELTEVVVFLVETSLEEMSQQARVSETFEKDVVEPARRELDFREAELADQPDSSATLSLVATARYNLGVSLVAAATKTPPVTRELLGEGVALLRTACDAHRAEAADDPEYRWRGLFDLAVACYVLARDLDHAELHLRTTRGNYVVVKRPAVAKEDIDPLLREAIETLEELEEEAAAGGERQRVWCANAIYNGASIRSYEARGNVDRVEDIARMFARSAALLEGADFDRFRARAIGRAGRLLSALGCAQGNEEMVEEAIVRLKEAIPVLSASSSPDYDSLSSRVALAKCYAALAETEEEARRTLVETDIGMRELAEFTAKLEPVGELLAMTKVNAIDLKMSRVTGLTVLARSTRAAHVGRLEEALALMGEAVAFYKAVGGDVDAFRGEMRQLEREIEQAQHRAKVDSSSENVLRTEGDNEEEAGIAQDSAAVETTVDAGADFAGTVGALKSRLIPSVTDHDITQLEAVIREAQQNPPSDKVGFVRDMRRMLEATGLEMRVGGDSRPVTLAMKNGSIALSVSRKGTVGFRGRSVELLRVEPYSVDPAMPTDAPTST